MYIYQYLLRKYLYTNTVHKCIIKQCCSRCFCSSLHALFISEEREDHQTPTKSSSTKVQHGLRLCNVLIGVLDTLSSALSYPLLSNSLRTVMTNFGLSLKRMQR